MRPDLATGRQNWFQSQNPTNEWNHTSDVKFPGGQVNSPCMGGKDSVMLEAKPQDMTALSIDYDIKI